MKKNNKDNKKYKTLAGRPTKMTEKTVNKLLLAFSKSFSDDEACVFADITKPTLYLYCKKNPEFSYQKEMLKYKPNIKAKINWIKKIEEGDFEASVSWLRSKAKDEFSTKQESGFTDKEGNDKDIGEININIIKNEPKHGND